MLEVEAEAAVLEAMDEVERMRGPRMTRHVSLPSRCLQVVESRCPRRCRWRWPEPRRRTIRPLGGAPCLSSSVTRTRRTHRLGEA